MPSNGNTKALARRSATPAPLVVQALQSLEEAVGGRAALVAALSQAPKTRDLEYVLGLLGDPDNQTVSLATLCASGGITAGELMTAYKDGVIQLAQVKASTVISQGLPGVVADTMKLAAPYEGVCYSCRGTGTYVPEPDDDEPNPSPGPCPTCQASGRLIYAGDLEHKKLALEIGRLTSKGAGVNVQVHQQANTFVGGAAGGALELLQAATDRLLYGGGAASGGPAEPDGAVEGELATPPEASPTAPDCQEDTY